jgi:hypothetical protein
MCKPSSTVISTRLSKLSCIGADKGKRHSLSASSVSPNAADTLIVLNLSRFS